MKKSLLILPAAGLLLGDLTSAQVTSISPGQRVRGEVVIDQDPDMASFVTYRFDAPDDTLAISIELEAVADLDLYLDSAYIEDYQSVIAASTSYAGNEVVQVDLSSDPESISDQYFVDVTYGRLDPPVSVNGQPLRRVPFTLTVTLHRQRVDRQLVPDEIVSGRIDPRASGPFRSYVVDVPRGTPALRVDLASDATDLDLRLRHAEPIRTTRTADHTAVSWAGNETIVVSSSTGSIAPGLYFIDVFDQAWLDWPADFRLLASFSELPPRDFLELPQIDASDGLGGAVNATVEILHADGSGTGVILTPSGHILTNYHVVEQAVESGTWNTASPLVGLTTEPTEGSRVRMLASILTYDRELDMALLKAEADLYGSPLPPGYRFPAINIGDPSATALGDHLFVLGYPDAGSLGTRVSITLTRGIVSGFERRGTTLLIKTDADIASGNSGGPVLNERYELIGIATEAISEELGNSQIGYIWPLWLVPEEWWRLVGIERPPPAPD